MEPEQQDENIVTDMTEVSKLADSAASINKDATDVVAAVDRLKEKHQQSVGTGEFDPDDLESLSAETNKAINTMENIMGRISTLVESGAFSDDAVAGDPKKALSDITDLSDAEIRKLICTMFKLPELTVANLEEETVLIGEKKSKLSSNTRKKVLSASKLNDRLNKLATLKGNLTNGTLPFNTETIYTTNNYDGNADPAVDGSLSDIVTPS